MYMSNINMDSGPWTLDRGLNYMTGLDWAAVYSKRSLVPRPFPPPVFDRLQHRSQAVPTSSI